MKLEDVLRAMRRNEPLSFEEIGQVLGMHSGSVFRIYTRAMRKLRERMRLENFE